MWHASDVLEASVAAVPLESLLASTFSVDVKRKARLYASSLEATSPLDDTTLVCVVSWVSFEEDEDEEDGETLDPCADCPR